MNVRAAQIAGRKATRQTTVQTMHVRRPSFVDDGQGGVVEELQTQGTVQIRLLPPTVEDETQARQSGSNVTHLAYVDLDDDVRVGDLLDNDYEVRAVREPSIPIYRLLHLRERQTR